MTLWMLPPLGSSWKILAIRKHKALNISPKPCALLLLLGACSTQGMLHVTNPALLEGLGTLKSLLQKGTFRVLGRFGSFHKIGAPQYGSQNTIILMAGTARKGPLILGNLHFPLSTGGERSVQLKLFRLISQHQRLRV